MPAKEESKGRRNFGRYEALEEIGRGMMGTVYRAQDPAIGRSVALKTFDLRLPVSDDERKEMEERFLREARAAGCLSHPNIVAIFDVGADGGVQYITEELIEGRSLAAVMAEIRPMPVAEVLRIGAQIANGLECAHAAGIVHRDLKPANILVRKDGLVKILDFGVARIAGSVLTQDRAVLGTPAYMSPEQVNGEDVDPRSDLFSFATILYEMLAGTRPFKGEKFTDLMAAIALHDPPPLVEARSDLAQSVDVALRKAFSKNREERFPSATALMEALAASLTQTWPDGTGLGVSTLPAPGTGRGLVAVNKGAGSWWAGVVAAAKRRRWAVGGAGAFSLIVLILVLRSGGDGSEDEYVPPPRDRQHGGAEVSPASPAGGPNVAEADGLARQAVADYEKGDLARSLDTFDQAYEQAPAYVARKYGGAYVRLLLEKADLIEKTHPQIAAGYRERAKRLKDGKDS